MTILYYAHQKQANLTQIVKNRKNAWTSIVSTFQISYGTSRLVTGFFVLELFTRCFDDHVRNSSGIACDCFVVLFGSE